MRLKASPRIAEVALLAGTPHSELATRCPDQRTHLPIVPCSDKNCPWSLDSPSYMNCSFMAFEAVAETGQGLTLEEIGQTIGLTREGVRQIQDRALLRLRRRMQSRSMV